MALISTKKLAEIYDNDLEINLSWIKNKFKLKPNKPVKFQGNGRRVKFIVTPIPEIMSELEKDTTSEVRLFNEYKDEIWDQIKIFSLYQFHLKEDQIIIGLEEKLNLSTIETPPGSQVRDFEDYQYQED